ncbi:MAG: UDP-N-acetylmuramoyl-L-alanyl-D-glutamate--2,6-diaminopimelate ligase, partial [Bacteroidetes bacterium]|nr:UDP-N-acetylmuramoyl-L-alanyl-D-glutamate--2,6-diaminopimelate ligase [Bacteroidota bacterium]
MPVLKDILYKVQLRSVAGNTDLPITDVQIDSRLVAAGTCFVAIKGVSSDGHAFIAGAIRAGAKAIVCEVLPTELQQDITYVQVANAAEAAGQMAHALHGEVTRKMKVVGVTGTNGKTTIATLLYQLFTAMGYKVGLISTVANRIAETIVPSTHTTPDTISLHTL